MTFPADCSWFYECVHGSVVGHIKCPDGLLWNNNLNTCDFPWNTECHTGGTKNNMYSKACMYLLWVIMPYVGSDGESVCQQHGFDAAQCWAIGCCHWNDDTESVRIRNHLANTNSSNQLQKALSRVLDGS